MTHERFRGLIAAYGADPQCGPVGEREAAVALLARAPALRAEIEHATALDAALDQWVNPAPLALDPAALAARISATPQPRAEIPSARRFRWPVLAWPNAAGLAAAAIAGFLIGWSGLDASLLPASADTVDRLVVANIIEDATW